MNRNTSLGMCAPALADRLEKLEASLHDAGIAFRRVETFRSAQIQDHYFAKGRTTEGPIVTHARGGQSPHNVAVCGVPQAQACDYVIFHAGKPAWGSSQAEADLWDCFGELARRADLRWGGDFKSIRDCGHVELKLWSTKK